jgi:hypothetical protein
MAGCQRVGKSEIEPVHTGPLIVDEAMLIRDWDRSVSYYPNGAVVAGPTLFLWEPNYDRMPWWTAGVWEPALFAGQTVAAPVVGIFQPVWSEVTYHGVRMPPTYTAVPPFPREPRVAMAVPAEPMVMPPAPTTQEMVPGMEQPMIEQIPPVGGGATQPMPEEPQK